MKFNKNFLLGVFVLFIVALSISYVSAEDIGDMTIDDTNVAIAPIADVPVTIDDGANLTTVQQKIDGATAGSTIEFATNGNYDFGNNSNPINVNKTLIFKGNNATINCLNGFYVQSADTTSIDGTSFVDFNFVNPSATWNGRAIEVRGGENLKVDNCKFLGNGNAGVYLRGVVGNITVSNCYFTGSTKSSTITPAGKGETGTKAINVMGGNGVTIINNTVIGPVLDGFSIASNAQNILVDNNSIDGAYYGIYYGGGLVNITTTNNNFTNIKAYGIGLVKSASYSVIKNNKFVMDNLPENGTYSSNTAIYMEQGNTAHGAATQIGNIFIYNNTFEKAAGVPANQTTYAVEIMSEAGPLKFNGAFETADNTYGDNIDKFIFLDKTWKYDNAGNMNVSQYTDDSVLTPADDNVTLKTGETTLIQLTGADGVVLPNQDVTLTIKQGNTTIKNQNLKTNKFGLISLANDLAEGTYTVVATFAGNTYNGAIFKKSSTTFTVNSVNGSVTPEKIETTITGNSLEKYTTESSRYYVTLTANGKALANQTVVIVLNGQSYNRTTNANGTTSIGINLPAGKYTAYLMYEGNDVYTDAVGIDTLTLKSIISGNSITKYFANATNYTFQIVDTDGKPLSGAKASLNINGVLYNRTTNAKGIGSMAINLGPGEYVVTVSYNGTSISNTITVLSIIESTNIEMTTANRIPFTPKILDGNGKPLANAKIQFNINGIMYERTTNAEGVATFQINLPAGEYIITSMYNGLSQANKVTITEV